MTGSSDGLCEIAAAEGGANGSKRILSETKRTMLQQ
jgi:hypothetical protein